MSIELKDFVNDLPFIERMNKSFADLRADYELSLDITKEKITELQEIHVDHKNFLANLASWSTMSSGILSGLRGTGKTHLFLLAREKINSNVEKDKTICVYLNVKRLHLPEKFDQELFNRIFSLFLYNEFSNQLINWLKEMEEQSALEKFLQLFNSDRRIFIKNINEALIKIAFFQKIVREGSQKIINLDKGTLNNEESDKELLKIQDELIAKLGLKDADLTNKLSTEYLKELTGKISLNNTYLTYLNIQDVRNQLIEVMKLLKIKAVTFFVDEWEKLYYNPNAQKYLAFYIDRIIDTPFYFWLGIVPHRGQLYNLDNGADLQHYINLDEGLVYENSKYDKNLCVAYFKEFINNRLKYYFSDELYDYTLLFNNEKNLDLLILASMGNTRDFGTMLLQCWSEYQTYRSNGLVPGRPYKYIHESMVIGAIKNNGDKKFSNIKDDSELMNIWKDLEGFCLLKKCSHFAIEETKENTEILSTSKFSEIIYHRLMHFRKGHVPAKNAERKGKLSIYALNYSGIYDLHAKDKNLIFVTDYETIHDRVRRYIYSPKTIIETQKIRKGEIFPCKNCEQSINLNSMKAAWEKNSCPYCGENIYNKE